MNLIEFNNLYINICIYLYFFYKKFIEKTTTNLKTEVYVKKWVDYSSKYGLGYLLSNGSTGVFFNDNTKIISDPKNT